VHHYVEVKREELGFLHQRRLGK